MATHARHHVAHFLVGSTTLGVLSSVDAPLLVIRYGIHVQGGMKRITVPVHRGQESSAALRLAAEIVRREAGELQLVTVVAAEREREAAAAFLTDLAGQHLAGLRVSTAVLRGSDIDREVLRHLEAAKADALFVNAGDEPTQLKIDLIRKAAVPVMLVPKTAGPG